MAVAGAIATWYFSRDVHGYRADVGWPALKSLGRALTKSFGSLALGSLILAVVQFLNFIVNHARSAHKKNKCAYYALSCLACCLGCVQRFVQFVNRFTYIHIAIYGDSFFTSAHDCYKLINRNMFPAAIVDLLGEFVLFVGRILGTAASTLLCIAIMNQMEQTIAFTTILLVVVISYCIFNLFSHIVGVGVDTVFVCYMIDLEQSPGGNYYITPELHQKLQSKRTADRGTDAGVA